MLAPPIAVALPYIETLVAALILAPSTRRFAGIAAVGLLVVFSIVIIVAIRRRSGIPCGCFGVDRSTPVSWASIARNAVLVVLAVTAAASSAGPVAPLPAVATGCGAALLLLLFDRTVGTFRGHWIRGDIVRG